MDVIFRVSSENSVLFTKREGVEFGTTEHKSIYRERKNSTTVHYWVSQSLFLHGTKSATDNYFI